MRELLSINSLQRLTESGARRCLLPVGGDPWLDTRKKPGRVDAHLRRRHAGDGTLGGGCVEAEVKRQALAVLGQGMAAVSRFQLDDDYGWDDGLICGGRMQVLIDPLQTPDEIAYFSRLQTLCRNGDGATGGDRVRRPGQRPAWKRPSICSTLTGQIDQSPAGTVGGWRRCRPWFARDCVRSSNVHGTRTRSHGVAFLPMLSRCRLIIVGGGHVGRAVGNLASELDFDVWVVDDRQEYVTEERFPHAQRRIGGPMAEVLPNLDVTPNTYCLIVTGTQSRRRSRCTITWSIGSCSALRGHDRQQAED